ncbi:transglycosylase domain-containing protein [Synechococcus sp. CCY9201]|uniref:transglycosylase domain-containing protein n=1 Tax=Synechococcus sp. CCY9201 TaxID=174697 RepID=UPI002B208282|nr:transglycosylase domain-containing protein [Synechococcus sp. CCY9201]MEA5473130.1 transglycosylase domain-containing protein [Synechococcus sp. CCY9201]
MTGLPLAAAQLELYGLDGSRRDPLPRHGHGTASPGRGGPPSASAAAAEHAEAERTKLEQIKPERTLRLHGGLWRIGRDPDLEIVIDHPAVSREHARLEWRGQHWLLQDAGSTNGLWWQGRRVQELLLRDGDAVAFGPEERGPVPLLVFRQPMQRRLAPLLLGTCLALAGLAGGGALLLGLALWQAPIRGSLANVRGPLALYDRNNRPLSSAEGVEHRELAALRDYPGVLIDALLASEDSRFWWHPGVDPIGTGRALVTNLVGGRVLEGGSTLTQQLARSLYPEQVGQGETLGRKWRELLVALQLEARFSKADLLLSYLNRVYLGVGWGFEDAARHYFDKPAARLELEEAALLVGLLPSPNGNDPCVAPEAALDSRNRVLAKMADTGRIGRDAARRARRRPVQLAPQACRSNGPGRNAPFYSDQVRRDLEALVGQEVAQEGNFLIDTHLDPALQQRVERQLRDSLARPAFSGVSQGAVVVLDSRSGGILAIAGGRDYRQSQFNRASMALRQPGSTFKLVPYLVALEKGARPGDRIGCGPLQWRGQFFASTCGGSLSLRQALARSSNTAALRLTQRVGLEAVVNKARVLGISSPLAAVPGLALGQSEVTLLELTGAYAAIANNGLWHQPSTIRRLTDAELCGGGARLADPATLQRCKASAAGSAAGSSRGESDPGGRQPTATVAPGRRVSSEATARALQDLLRAVVRSGTGSAAYLGGQEGGKTGTTNEGRDLLFVGFEPRRHWVIGVWLGNDDNRPTHASSALAAGLWGDLVRGAGTTSPTP